MYQPVMALAVGAVVLLAGCTRHPDSPGLEYMPDMYRSPAIEAYVDYGQDPYYVGEEKAREQRETPSARLPVQGTIPFAKNEEDAAYNFPFPFEDTQADYERAGRELHSPIPMTQAVVDQGKELYDIFCLHCHGKTGQGDGPVVNNGNYPPPPPYDGHQLKDLPEGQIFHAITYGRNIAMGAHASQLNKQERWLLTRYVQYLQNGGHMPGEQPEVAADATDEGAADQPEDSPANANAEQEENQ